jgi:hypothetical protein
MLLLVKKLGTAPLRDRHCRMPIHALCVTETNWVPFINLPRQIIFSSKPATRPLDSIVTIYHMQSFLQYNPTYASTNHSPPRQNGLPNLQVRYPASAGKLGTNHS